MNTDPLSLAFAALADPTRRAILARLAQGEATVMALAEPFELSQPAVSKHLKVLERAGLIARSRAAQTRPCRLEPEALAQVTDWVAGCRSTWEARFDRLDHLLGSQSPPSSPSSQTPPSKGSRHARPRR